VTVPAPVRAVIISVGDELLLGHTVDTNAAWLSLELAAAGIPVRRRHTVADEAEEIQGALAEAIAVADLVICTGGLGPTLDDITLDAVAGGLGRALAEDPDIVADLERRFLRRGRGPLPPSNLRQARVPEGGWSLPNALGSAPGVAISEGDRLVVLLPGVPMEMKALFREQVRPLLAARFAGRLASPVHRVIHTTGISESLLGERVAAVLPDELGPLSVAFLPDVAGVDVRLTVQGVQDPVRAEGHLDDLEALLAPVVGPYRFEASSGDLVEAVRDRMIGEGLTLATAESCTGGLIATRITGLPGASLYYLGGVVAYDNRVKEEMLAVDSKTLESFGAVSQEVAEAMANGIARALSAHAGIGITGVAGPDGGTDEKPVGTVWYAVALEKRVEARCQRFSGDRTMIRERSAQAALALLLGMLDDRTSAGGP